MTKKRKSYSIVEFSNSKFPIHGTVIAKIEGKILTYDITGPFNEELMQSLLEYQTEIFNDWRPEGKFGILSTVKGSILLSPHAFDLWVETVRHNATSHQNCYHVWAISLNVEGRQLIVPKMLDVYRKLGLVVDFFEDEIIARNFLAQKLDVLL